MKLRNYAVAAVIIFATCLTASGQKLLNPDSLKKHRQDSIYDEALFQKVSSFFNNNTDSSAYYIKKEKAFSQKVGYLKGEIRSQLAYAMLMSRLGNLPLSIKTTFAQLPRARAIHLWRAVAQCYNVLGSDYAKMGDQKAALNYFLKFKAVTDSNRVVFWAFASKVNVANQYINMNMADSAQYYADLAESVLRKNHDTSSFDQLFGIRGRIEVLKGNYKKGIDYCRMSLLKTYRDFNMVSTTEITIAAAYQQLNRPDSCVYYAEAAYRSALIVKNPYLVVKATELLKNEYYTLKNYKNAFDYQQIMLKARDSLYNIGKAVEIQNELYNEAQKARRANEIRVELQNRIRLYIVLGVLSVMVIIAVFLLYANSQRKKANKLLQQRNEQIENQHEALEKSFSDLKATQTQLIQSEKMASLGELTAGIAHEIQNPLNFVNNFSEVSIELLDELKEEAQAGHTADVIAIADDLTQNLEKINHHGKRADFIVKGMLQHSRTATGEKQLTNINILADEFLRLSYHGLRAKDKNFNAELVTNFDEILPKVNIAQQDIGRVLLNLFNNAFYAVNQKQKTAGPDYKPEVAVSTTIEKNHLIITVKDNGNGIPDNIKDKIMQPFFTTKPTGEGTGLGLSLSYDIVVKGHGGKIDLESEDGVGSTFTITLPA
jgi:signal transduction histidine kinase